MQRTLTTPETTAAKREAAQARAAAGMAAIEAHKSRMRAMESEAELRALARMVRRMARREPEPATTKAGPS
jgi:hypothetical protein